MRRVPVFDGFHSLLLVIWLIEFNESRGGR